MIRLKETLPPHSHFDKFEGLEPMSGIKKKTKN